MHSGLKSILGNFPAKCQKQPRGFGSLWLGDFTLLTAIGCASCMRIPPCRFPFGSNACSFCMSKIDFFESAFFVCAAHGSAVLRCVSMQGDWVIAVLVWWPSWSLCVNLRGFAPFLCWACWLGILRSYGELASGVVVAADILAVKAYPTANLQKAGPKVVQAEVLGSFRDAVHAIAMPLRYAHVVAG